MSLYVVGGGDDGGQRGPTAESSLGEAERMIAGVRLRIEGIANRLAELRARLAGKDAHDNGGTKPDDAGGRSGP